jgi:hypothetical protein
MLVSVKEMKVPTVVNIKTTDKGSAKKDKFKESMLTDITRYYDSEEVKNESEFVEKINIIKSHFQMDDHPLSQFLSIFSEEFWKFYTEFLRKKDLEEDDIYEMDPEHLEEATYSCKKGIKNIIFWFCIVIIAMYKLDLAGKELDQDLLLNTITSLLLKNDVYFTLYNLLAKSQTRSLSHIQENMNKLQKLRPQHLGVSDILSLDSRAREHFAGSFKSEHILNSTKQPYFLTIDRLQNIMQIEWNLTKMDIIFRIFTGILWDELKMFWENYKYKSKKELFVDSDSLRLLMIYVLIQVKKSKLKIDLDLIQEFMPPVLEFTNRAYYITLLQSAFEYIESLTEDKIEDLIDRWTLHKSLWKDQHRWRSFHGKLFYYFRIRSCVK